jgi:hypothetical protein
MQILETQPYIITVSNISNVPAEAIILGGLYPAKQSSSIIVEGSHASTYQDILIQLFLQETVAEIRIRKIHGNDFESNSHLAFKAWDANGNQAYFLFRSIKTF